MVDAFVDAGKIKQETGEWPTLQDVYDKIFHTFEALNQDRQKADREKIHEIFELSP